MSKNPIALKIAAPYAGSFYDFCVEKDLMYQVTTDFQSIEAFFAKTPDLVNYLTNPIVSADSKKEILEN